MVLMGTKDCVFVQMYEELYKLHYDRDAWYFNGGELPQYAILDKYPGVAFLADEGVQQGKYHKRLIHEHSACYCSKLPSHYFPISINRLAVLLSEC